MNSKQDGPLSLKFYQNPIDGSMSKTIQLQPNVNDDAHHYFHRSKTLWHYGSIMLLNVESRLMVLFFKKKRQILLDQLYQMHTLLHLSNFKKRHNIFEVTKSGEAASTPSERLLEYRMNLQTKTTNYNRSDVYNCDETALYWDLMPSKTLAHGSLSGTKKSKNRVTVMLTCNASGDKLLPLFIHKFNTPRTLKRNQ